MGGLEAFGVLGPRLSVCLSDLVYCCRPREGGDIGTGNLRFDWFPAFAGMTFRV